MSLSRLFKVVALTCLLVAIATAANVTYGNPFGMYGTVVNQSCGGGICAAAQALNSFIFLNNFYSGIYNATNVTTGNHANPTQASLEFANGDGTGGDICGYYNRFGTCGTNNGVNQNYVDTKNDWMNAYAPNTTNVFSQTNGPQGFNLLTTFIGPELRDHEDVELFIYGADANGKPTTEGHVISPMSITYDPADPNAGITMTYQDPNFPTLPQTQTVTVNGAGYLQFNDASTF